MKRTLGVMLLACMTAASQDQPAQQVWSGRLSDSMCAASHQMKASAGRMSERECLFECLKALAGYVLVDNQQQVLTIANQDLGGFPLYAGRPVRITGILKNGAIVATKVEAIPAHLHLGHVMTNWRDTPSNVGFLIAAISDGKVAVNHAELAAKSSDSLDDMKLHAGHVLHALDTSIEAKGPGSGYGVKKAAAGALQHLEFAVQAEGASANMKTLAAPVSASLTAVLRWTDQAAETAQKIQKANTAPETLALANELASLTRNINDGLQQSKTNMDAIMKGEGLENAPR